MHSVCFPQAQHWDACPHRLHTCSACGTVVCQDSLQQHQEAECSKRNVRCEHCVSEISAGLKDVIDSDIFCLFLLPHNYDVQCTHAIGCPLLSVFFSILFPLLYLFFAFLFLSCSPLWRSCFAEVTGVSQC